MHLMFLLTSCTHWHYLLFHCSCSAIVTHAEESPIHVDAVMDPLSSIGQRLTPLLVLLQEWIKPSLRICFNPMARVLPFCWPTTWLSSSYVSTCFAWIFEQTCVLPNFKLLRSSVTSLQTSLTDLPLKNFYRFVLPSKVSHFCQFMMMSIYSVLTSKYVRKFLLFID
jgi:hypothetical protein